VTPATLQVKLLGSFQIIYAGEPASSLHTARLQALLACLLLHAGTPQPRQQVAFRLWPDTSEANAHNNLRQRLHQLRQNLPDADRFISADAHTLGWRLDEEQEIDILDFERALAEAEAAERGANLQAAQRWLEQALSLYQGDLLPGCYDDWIAPERERLYQACQRSAQKLVELLERQGEYAAALQAAQKLLRLDPLDENSYAQLVRLHGLNNDRPAVRRVFQSAVETLQRELGVEPGEGLRQAYASALRAARTSHPPAAPPPVDSTPLPLVGRQAEWQQLQSAWRQAARGEARLVLISGEAGIGKSRLAEELFNWASQQGLSVARTRSYAAEGRLSLAPVSEWLRSPGLNPHLASLNALWLTEVARLLPELLTEYPGLARPQPVSEYGQRLRFFEALARAMLAAPRPLLLWIDDLQWCDPETIEWLHFLLRFEPRSALLVLGTARSEESPRNHPLVDLAHQLRGEGKLDSIELAPLDAAEAARLASQVAERQLNEAEAIFLYYQTEGNPLFVVETMRAGMGSEPTIETPNPDEPPGSEAHALPPRVYAVIARRLAQLSPPARKVTELGAANGRAFSLDLLAQAGQENEESAIQALDELWQKRIVREQAPNLYDFTHDKLREVAYVETSLPQRRLLHRRIAQALETLNADDLDPVSAQIAAQYEQAGLFEQALPYYQRAGEIAANIYANDEAIALLRRALALLSHFPAERKRDIQELGLQLTLSSLYSIARGWTSPEVEQYLNQALILSDKVGDPEQRAQTLYGLQTLYAVQAQLEKVQNIHPEMHKLFMLTQGSLPPNAGLMHASATFHSGDLLEAHEQFKNIVAVRDDRYFHNLLASEGWNYLVHGSAYLSHILWCLGYAQSALDRAHAAIEYAHEFVQPFDQAKAITYLALLQEWRADPGTFRACAEDAYALTEKYNAPYYHAWASILLHFAQAWQQPDGESLKRLQGAIHTFAKTGAHLRLPIYFSLLARVCQRAGWIDLGLKAVEQGFSESRQNGEHWWDAELHRLRGELIWSQGAEMDEIEAAFRRATEIAQSQQAKSLELRAATSLARLWQANGKPAAARELLAPLYAWFSEGFDTPGLQKAQALINEL
jgi:DNA-binding SARP family transcriptional activator/tetratricopeptide (TPR) repeat protein